MNILNADYRVLPLIHGNQLRMLSIILLITNSIIRMWLDIELNGLEVTVNANYIVFLLIHLKYRFCKLDVAE